MVRSGTPSGAIQEGTLTSSLAALIDHTALRADTSEADVRALVGEARTHRFAAVCIPPSYVKLAARLLEGTEIGVCTVVGFPLGVNCTAVKTLEAMTAIEDGATEIDMVLNIGYLQAGRSADVQADIRAVVESVHPATVKVIMETALLTDPEKVLACRLSVAAGASFVKTSTGYANGGATCADVRLLRRTVGDSVGVKASGGIRTRADALALVEAGATRLGCSSSLSIIR